MMSERTPNCLDVVSWAPGTRDDIKRLVLKKLNAAKGGRTPLRPGEYNLPDLH
jgi:hypothetical protein